MSNPSGSNRLLRMTEQIAANLGGAIDPKGAGERTAAHLQRFWTRQMIAELLQLSTEPGIELSAATREALQRLTSDRF